MMIIYNSLFEIFRSVRKHENSQMDSLFDSFNESYFGDPKQSEERDLSTDLPKIHKGKLNEILLSL